MAPANGTVEGSPLAAIRQAVEAKQVKTTMDLELPGALEGHLAVRYHAISWEKSEAIRERYEEADAPDARLLMLMDHLINACDSLLVREGGRWVPLLHEGRKVRFDATLAANLGVPDGAVEGTADTHVICRGLFAAAAGGLSAPEDGVSQEEHWEQALERADHLIETVHRVFGMWMKGGAEVGLAAEEALGE
jgi:hypothetical protein